MHRLTRGVLAALFITTLAAGLGAQPPAANAQCSMMGGGVHDHAGAQSAVKISGSEKKARQNISRLLSDEQGRALLMDALLNDRVFMETFIQRLASVPEWNAMVSRQLASPAPTTARDEPGAIPAVAVYTCPMHKEITAAGPGTCPKCGMALVQVQPAKP